MEDIDNLLEQFKQKAEAALEKKVEDYPSFKDLEKEYFDLINEGNLISKKILENPENCDNSTYLILTRRVAYNFVDKIRGRYSALQLVPDITKKLFSIYRERMKKLTEEENYPELIRLNEQMYQFSKRYFYRKNIADILYQKYQNFKQAMEIYQEIEPEKPKDPEYWSNYAELCQEYDELEKRDYCLKQKEIFELKKSVQKLIDDKDYDDAIKLDERLFDLTEDYQYKLDIANIIAVCKLQPDKAIKMYKEYQPKKGDDKNYWYQLSDIYLQKKNYYKQVLCLQKAINIELSEPEEKSEAGV